MRETSESSEHSGWLCRGRHHALQGRSKFKHCFPRNAALMLSKLHSMLPLGKPPTAQLTPRRVLGTKSPVFTQQRRSWRRVCSVAVKHSWPQLQQGPASPFWGVLDLHHPTLQCSALCTAALPIQILTQLFKPASWK